MVAEVWITISIGFISGLVTGIVTMTFYIKYIERKVRNKIGKNNVEGEGKKD